MRGCAKGFSYATAAFYLTTVPLMNTVKSIAWLNGLMLSYIFTVLTILHGWGQCCSLILLMSGIEWGRGKVTEKTPPRPARGRLSCMQCAQNWCAMYCNESYQGQTVLIQLTFPFLWGGGDWLFCLIWLTEQVLKNNDTEWSAQVLGEFFAVSLLAFRLSPFKRKRQTNFHFWMRFPLFLGSILAAFVSILGWKYQEWRKDWMDGGWRWDPTIDEWWDRRGLTAWLQFDSRTTISQSTQWRPAL